MIATLCYQLIFFQAVAEALEQAKETIYIADWWLSPELVKPPGGLFFIKLTPGSS
jgi:hypothetical protein